MAPLNGFSIARKVHVAAEPIHDSHGNVYHETELVCTINTNWRSTVTYISDLRLPLDLYPYCFDMTLVSEVYYDSMGWGN